MAKDEDKADAKVEDDEKADVDAKDDAPAPVERAKAARVEVEPDTEGTLVSSAIVIAVALAAAVGFLSLTR